MPACVHGHWPVQVLEHGPAPDGKQRLACVVQGSAAARVDAYNGIVLYRSSLLDMPSTGGRARIGRLAALFAPARMLAHDMLEARLLGRTLPPARFPALESRRTIRPPRQRGTSRRPSWLHGESHARQTPGSHRCSRRRPCQRAGCSVRMECAAAAAPVR